LLFFEVYAYLRFGGFGVFACLRETYSGFVVLCASASLREKYSFCFFVNGDFIAG
jgi:hypothetical protein